MTVVKAVRVDPTRWGEVDLPEAIAEANIDPAEPFKDVAEGWRQIESGIEQLRDELVFIGLGQGEPETVCREARVAAALLLILADQVEEDNT